MLGRLTLVGLSRRMKKLRLAPADELAAQLSATFSAASPDLYLTFQREYRFAAWMVGGPGRGLRKRLEKEGLRDWRFDFAWPERQLAVEVDGGVWNSGRHVRGTGYTSDCEKCNEAVLCGWWLLRVTSAHVRSGQALRWITRALMGDMGNER